jgi:phosphate-selective porin OprO/OprP
MKTIVTMVVLTLMISMLQAQDSSSQDRFNQYGRLVSRSPLDVENRNGILVFETPDQSYRLWFDIRVQVDAQLFSTNTFNPIGNGASIRRARFATKTNLTKNWYGELDLDFANGILELNDAYIQYDFRNGLAARVGNFKERFSMSQTSSSRYLNFLERPMAVVAMTPSRHIGLEASHSAKYFVVSAGLFGQAVEDAETRTFTEDNNKDYGRDEGLSITEKIAILPFGDAKDYGGHLAYAHSYRQPKTSVDVSEYGGIRYSTRSLSSINRKKYLDTDVIPSYSYSSLNNFELAAYYKGLGVQAEYLLNRVHRQSDLANLDFSGFYAQAACLLFGGKQFYNKTEAEFSQPYRGQKWGDIELALRYDYINMNDKDIYGGSAEGYTAGLNFYADKNVRFQVNYSYVNHDRYASGKKKLFVGYDLNGALTKDPAKVADAKGKAGEDFGMLGFRFEINF